jgi:hypothetical protein
MGNVRKEANTMCRRKFIDWALQNRIIASKHEDFESEPAWLAWRSSWATSNLMARSAVRKEYRQYNQPLSDEEIKELWTYCSGGKSFARMIEYKHGIKE